MNTYPIKNYKAGADIDRYLIVKFGGDDETVVPAAAATDNLIGIGQETDVKSGDHIDVSHGLVHQVRAGGSISAGGPLTSDSAGKAVAAAPANDTNMNIIGWALSDGADGDIIPLIVAPGQIQGEPA